MTFSVTVLGCSAAIPVIQRFSTAHLLQTDGRFFLIDCGEGTQIQLRRYGLSAMRIQCVFISHMHGDHTFGLPGLLSTMGMNGRTEPLHLFGPAPLEGYLQQVYAFFNPPEFEVIFHALPDQPQQIFEDKQLTVSCFPLKHRIKTWGFRFEEKERLRNIRPDMIAYYRIPVRDIPGIKAGNDFVTEDGEIIPNRKLTVPGIPARSYAFCSDTVYNEDMLPYIDGVDLLYHEATYAADQAARAAEVFHCTTVCAARIAVKAHARQLMIGHYSAKYKELEPLLQEARTVFPDTILATDGLTVKL
ncbi:MAG: ribonuclease Z [Bacteroidales bacterium]|jgi:ribonuclease Z|nr:ribonuclease Z [Bacteroidales bacterium]